MSHTNMILWVGRVETCSSLYPSNIGPPTKHPPLLREGFVPVVVLEQKTLILGGGVVFRGEWSRQMMSDSDISVRHSELSGGEHRGNLNYSCVPVGRKA